MAAARSPAWPLPEDLPHTDHTTCRFQSSPKLFTIFLLYIKQEGNFTIIPNRYQVRKGLRVQGGLQEEALRGKSKSIWGLGLRRSVLG